MIRTSTLALIVTHRGDSRHLLDTLLDENEIHLVETALRTGDVADPLKQIYERRDQQVKQESEFGDYVEGLLSQPCVNPVVQEQGLRWLRSKIRIEQFQKTEREAAKIIADYAYKIFVEDPDKVDFFLASPTSRVRIRIFLVR